MSGSGIYCQRKLLSIKHNGLSSQIKPLDGKSAVTAGQFPKGEIDNHQQRNHNGTIAKLEGLYYGYRYL